MVGLAAEHKGAWVIIDLGITLMAEENRSTFCNTLSQIGSLNAIITTKTPVRKSFYGHYCTKHFFKY